MVQTPAATRWSKLVDQHEASGLTLGEFAAQHGVNKSTLGWWRRKLGKAKRMKPRQPAFVEVAVKPPDDAVVVALERFRAHIVVDKDTDLDLLRRVLGALC